MAQQFELASPPSDGISRVLWLSDASLVVSSWDGSVALHEVGAGSRRVSAYAHKGGVLDVAGAGGSVCYSGGLDMAVLRHDFAAGATEVLGAHAAAVRCVEHCAARGLVLSGSWDKTVRAWDARSSSSSSSSSGGGGSGGSGCVATLALPDRCYAMALLGENTLVAGSAGRHVRLYDLRRLGGSGEQLEGGAGGSSSSSSSSSSAAALAGQAREGSMKHQTRAIRGLPDGSGFVTGSIEGRVAVDFVDLAPAVQEKKYAFKCHRQKLASGEEKAFPVNALAFHPQQGTFATGGGDGAVCVWDYAQKKRVATLAHPGSASGAFPNPIASLAFSPCGTRLAIAASYGWEQGDPAALPVGTPQPPPDAVFVRDIAEADVKPKQKK